MKKLDSFVFPALIIVGAALLRLVPHAPNFAPIGAMALFGGAYLPKRWALVLPLAAMFLSDIFIGFDGVDGRAAVYGSFLLIGLLGIWLGNHKSAANIIGASLAGSLLFFLITNFTVLYTESLYPRTWAGLLESYTMALPFFRYTVLGDVFYTAVFFGGFELAVRMVKKPAIIGVEGGKRKDLLSRDK